MKSDYSMISKKHEKNCKIKCFSSRIFDIYSMKSTFPSSVL